MTVDDARVARGDGNVGEQPRRKASADRRAVHRRHDGLRAIDHVANEVSRLLPDADPRVVVVGDRLDEGEIAAGGKPLPRPAQQRRGDIRVLVHGAPDVGEVGVGAGVHGRRVHRHAQHPVGGFVEAQRIESGVAGEIDGHRELRGQGARAGAAKRTAAMAEARRSRQSAAKSNSASAAVGKARRNRAASGGSASAARAAARV